MPPRTILEQALQAQESGDFLTALQLENVAQMHEALGELPQAIEAYKKVIDQQPHATEASHRRQSVKADMLGHYAFCLYKAKDSSALQIALVSLDDLQRSTDANKYERNVWLSGAHMRIAQMYTETDKNKVTDHLNSAEEIINSNSDLILRKEQLQKLKEKLIQSTPSINKPI